MAYPTSVISFTTKSSGDTIQAAHVNDLQTEVVAIEDALINGGITINGTVYIGNETANAGMTLGLTINQGVATDEIVAWKASNVAHGVTGVAETDTWGFVQQVDGGRGGTWMYGLLETGSNQALKLTAVATDATATRSTAGDAPLVLEAALRSGTTTATVGANQNLVVIRDAGTARFFCDSDGDSHQDVGTAWTNFDTDDDVAILEAVAVALAREGDPLREAFVRSFESHRAAIERLPGKALVAFNDDGHHFVNMSRLAMVHHGAIRQVSARYQRLLALLRQKGLLGTDECRALLSA